DQLVLHTGSRKHMVAVAESLSWLSPSPIWHGLGDVGGNTGAGEEFLRPAILRFAHDGFMDELYAALAFHPGQLGEWRAVGETWERPMRTPPTTTKLSLAEPVSQVSVRRARDAARRS